MAADFACKTINPQDPAGPKIDAIFPAGYTSNLFKHWPVDFEVPFPPDRVFAVYLNPRMRVYECRAEYVADDDPLCPINWQTRYRGLTWRKNIS